MNVLFVCTANGGRSVIAERLLAREANGRHAARSAGSNPGSGVHPQVLEALNEIGIDASDHVPRKLDDDAIRWADVVVATCDDACPVVPGKRYVAWQLPDPKNEPIERVREIRDDIAARVHALLEALDDGAGSRATVYGNEIATKSSPRSVADTVSRLTELLAANGLTLFAVIDQSAEAGRVGLDLRETVLVIFGSPVAGTPVMQASPLAAVDLPLKVLVWADGAATKVSYTTPEALAARHHLDAALAAKLTGIDSLTDALVAP